MSELEFPREAEPERIRYPEIDLSSEPGSTKSEEEDIVDDKLFVAVGKDVKENRSTVIWALQNSGGKKICIIHVHTPAQMIPILGGKFPILQVGKQEVMAYREKERREMLKALDEYIQLCAKAGVSAQKIFIEASTIENGIIMLISQKRIGRLVMGAATDNKYKKNMTELKSKKAIYVQSQAPVFCHIWFICKGYLIYTRAGVKPPYPNHESVETHFMRSQLMNADCNSQSIIDREKYNSRPIGVGENKHHSDELSTPRMNDGSSYESEYLSRINVPESARPSTSSEAVSGWPLSYTSSVHYRKNEAVLDELPLANKYVGSSTSSLQQGRSMNDELYDEIDKLMAEVDNLRQEANLESMNRQNAEKEIVEAIRKAKAAESLYHEEQKRRKEVEEKLANEEEELEIIKNEHTNLVEELRAVLYQKSSLESEIEKLNLIVEEVDGKIVCAVGLLEKYKKQRDDLEIERDNALYEAESLRSYHDHLDPTATQISRFFADFTYLEIAEATDDFNPSRKIGEGGFGITYKGLLRHTEVAIKLLNPESLQGPQEFIQEVDILSKLRHPNIVTLIGVCSQASALVYEYHPNGSLEDRLACRDNTQPLLWQTRIKIAAELCSVLMFLHSSQPESIVHGDLKPDNILLDARLSCKLSDFGICRTIANDERSMDNTTRLYRTDPKGTFAYIDPEFLLTGELTPKSDIYSFGIILLRLLTGKLPLGLPREVQYALDKDNLHAVLDPSAGDWPFVQAKQLALLALRCCEMRRKNRPDLVADIWRVLEPMRVSCRSSSSAQLGGDEHDHLPSYFICPIFQEVMQDPHIAADGYTYEAEALRGWLDSGHNTSPMTNLKLANNSLIPNHALRSAIQEWLQHRRQSK